jgi:hypothetical protein
MVVTLKIKKLDRYLLVAALAFILLWITFAWTHQNVQSPTPSYSKLKGVDYLDWWTGGPGQSGPGGSGQITYMKQWGCNIVRIVIHPRQASVGFAWNILDDVVNTALRNNMVVILANHYWSDGVDDLSKWTEEQWQAWLSWLELLTSRYKNMPNVYINIINEPLGLTRTDYVTRMRQGIDKVRAIDPAKTVVVDPRFWDTYFNDVMPLNRENIIWDPHYYYYSWMGDASSQEAIRAWFTQYRWDVAIKRGEKVWLGEFNFDPDVINGPTWYRNVMEVCDEDGFLGFASWIWAPTSVRPYGLLVDWQGTPSQTGQLLKNYLSGSSK